MRKVIFVAQKGNVKINFSDSTMVEKYRAEGFEVKQTFEEIKEEIKQSEKIKNLMRKRFNREV